MNSSLGSMETILICSLIILWFYSLAETLFSKFTCNNKLLWFLVVLFGSFVGAIIYFFIGRKERIKGILGENKSLFIKIW